MRKQLLHVLLVTVMLAVGATTAHAGTYVGDLYYTRFSGTPNVTRLGFNYDDTTHTLAFGTQVNIASLNGADGIMFAPNGNLIVTSNSTNAIYRLDSATGALLQTVATGGTPNFHMALDPSGTQFYSSDRYTRFSGPLDTFVINPDGSFNNATTTAITGGDSNVTQLAFAPNGKVFYTDGGPNSNGSIGLFSFGSPDVTTQLIAPNVVPASHGIVYDPFTGLMTMFGGGQVASIDPNQATNALTIASLKQYDVPGIGDFDQGSVDGYGHAFIAGSGAITFIDYSVSHDITHPDLVIIRTTDGSGAGFGNIDDVAPLVGLGAQATPEPVSLALLGVGLVGMAAARFRKKD